MIAGLFGALVVFLFLYAGTAHADTTFTVTYKVAEGCPDRDRFINGIQRRSQVARPVGPAEQPDVVFTVDIVARGRKKQKISGRMVITRGVDTSERTVTGSSCVEVASALALIATLAIDPLAETLPPPEPLPVPPLPYGPATLDAQPRLILPPTGPLGPAPLILPPLTFHPGMLVQTVDPEVFLATKPLPADVWPPLPPRRGGIDFGFGLRTVLDVGPAATPLSGAGGLIELRSLGTIAWSLRADLSYAVTTETTSLPSFQTRQRMLRGRVLACVPGWQPLDWFRLWPCASFGGGAQWVTLVRTVDNAETEALGPWLELGVSARIDLVPVPWLAIELQPGPALALTRGVFETPQGTLIHSPSAVGFQLGIGATASF